MVNAFYGFPCLHQVILKGVRTLCLNSKPKWSFKAKSILKAEKLNILKAGFKCYIIFEVDA